MTNWNYSRPWSDHHPSLCFWPVGCIIICTIFCLIFSLKVDVCKLVKWLTIAICLIPKQSVVSKRKSSVSVPEVFICICSYCHCRVETLYGMSTTVNFHEKNTFVQCSYYLLKLLLILYIIINNIYNTYL